VAGKPYYFEGYHKEAAGDDHFEVYWQYEDDQDPVSIPADVFRPYAGNDADQDDDGLPTELDVYKVAGWEEDALFRPEVREAYRDLVDQGWIDAIRHLHPGERIYTFWDYFRNAYGRNAGLRLDHFLLSPEVAGRLKTAGVDREVRGWEKSSDHAPVWIELKAKGRKGRLPSRRSRNRREGRQARS
jgi:hypothetical protein